MIVINRNILLLNLYVEAKDFVVELTSSQRQSVLDLRRKWFKLRS